MACCCTDQIALIPGSPGRTIFSFLGERTLAAAIATAATSQERTFSDWAIQPLGCYTPLGRPTGAFTQQETFAITIGGKGLRQIFKRCSVSGKGKTTAK